MRFSNQPRIILSPVRCRRPNWVLIGVLSASVVFWVALILCMAKAVRP